MLPVHTVTYLQQLQALLTDVGLWQQQPIEASALASSAPFACDTMTFAQWLQFIFVPRMNLLIEQGQGLPGTMALAPMAEHLWQGQDDKQALIAFLQQFDEYLS
ncbi:YqcC family protein [Shewanella sp. NIFS-20-20]|uniref:YqcC family protein n=1 Tax=Shewanella sp. NIFS-20-20 TaxID=2853806 RepID=UPI001C47C786|nr:YqcC family protein [Shewanella sp. NIFS-20-20]MBV7317323.1 YqcC family protein [Shewanella sp. NIFS-20-20]